MVARGEVLAFIGLIILSFAITAYLNPLKISGTEHFDVEGEHGLSITRHYDRGERIEGYFTVRGGNEEIDFKIEDPYGVDVYNPGSVKSRCDFSLTTEHDGVYTLWFRNAAGTTKTIFLSQPYNPLAGLVLPLILVSAGILIIGVSYEIRRRFPSMFASKKGLPPPPPSSTTTSHAVDKHKSCRDPV